MKVSLLGSDDTPGVAKRVLGPSADVLGEAFARWTELRTQNVGRVLENAESKLGDRMLESGSVPPRVAARLLDEGSYCDDHVMVEYLGGVLASARTPVGRDDRGAKWTALVTSLSAYEIRMHYVLYASMRAAYTAASVNDSVELNWTESGKLEQLSVVMGGDGFIKAMAFDASETASAITPEAVITLKREALIGHSWSILPPSEFETKYQVASPQGGAIVAAPSMAGLQLWMWAHGRGDEWSEWTNVDVGDSFFEAPIPVSELESSVRQRLRDGNDGDAN